jgi:hypothetical protein
VHDLAEHDGVVTAHGRVDDDALGQRERVL